MTTQYNNIAMTEYEYEEVQNCTNLRKVDEDDERSWIPFLRQMLICSGAWTTYFQCGLNVGTPTVLIPQLRREANSTDVLSQQQASWLSSASYLTVHWLLILVPSAYYFGRRTTHVFVTAFSTESPYWLASRGRLEESRKTFIWLQGSSKTKELELEKLMKATENRNSLIENDETIQAPGYWKSIFSVSFYKPMLLIAITYASFQFTGKLVITVYAIDIVKKITGSESKAYAGMLILDGVTVFGMYLGCFLSRRLPRRVQLITGTSGGIASLLSMSLYLYLINCSLIMENVYVSVSLLCVGSLCVCCGPVLLTSTIVGELLPLHHRNLAVALSSIIASLSSALLIKLAPQLFAAIGIDGSFLFFGLATAFCLILMYKYLPETKDKTLVEISEDMLSSST